jgi:hypothetical protein
MGNTCGGETARLVIRFGQVPYGQAAPAVAAWEQPARFPRRAKQRQP